MAPTGVYRFNCLLTLAMITCYYTCHCVRYKIVQERSILVYNDPDHFKNFTVKTGRRGRDRSAETNISAVIVYPMGNNVTVNNTIYELRSNEYRRGFFDISYKLCDMVDDEKIIIPLLSRGLGRKVVCPLQGQYSFCLSQLDSSVFPTRVPWTNIKLDTIMWTKKDGEIARIFYYMRFDEILGKTRTKNNKSPRPKKLSN